MRPFVLTGVTFRNIWLDRDNRDRFVARGSRGLDNSSDLGVGAIAGGGVALKAWRFTVAPELRYTRWGGNNYPATNVNQAQVLLRISF